MNVGRYSLGFVLVALMASVTHAQNDLFRVDGGPIFNEVIFNQSFTKEKGPFSQSVIINNPGETVRIFLQNGVPFPADEVNRGSVTLNGQELFNAHDFTIEYGNLLAVVTKEVTLLNGDNVLDVQLKGRGMGTMNLRILRAMSLSFPAGTVFVAPRGNDSNACDAISTPCATITQGLARAVALAGPQVLVANGVYVEHVSLVNGINVLGGYSSDFTRRDVPGTGTAILGGASSLPTVLAASITSATLFEGFIVHGPTVTTPGGSSVAVSITNSTSPLQVQHNVIVGGAAGNGARGVDGFNGVAGVNGSAGGNSQNMAVTILGGQGGPSPSRPGGRGGQSTPPIFNAQNGIGVTGQGPLGGLGGAGGYNGRLDGPGCTYILPSSSIDAGPGGTGGDGTHGAAGVGGLASSGTGLSGTWSSASGGAGTAGTSGSGGGGGGAGGGGAFTVTSSCVPNVVTGPSGGGGGAGGAGGIGGLGGQGGGGVFNIFVLNGGPTILNNRLFLGTAGDGGSGGNGGVGGSGGAGGAAGTCLVLGCGAAGAGSTGGSGGHAGGGGGGAGGPSVGIYSNFTGGYEMTNHIDLSTGVAGVGGAGGQSFMNNGHAGAPGSVLAILVE